MVYIGARYKGSIQSLLPIAFCQELASWRRLFYTGSNKADMPVKVRYKICLERG